ncbi:MAG: hypothetical protein KF735_08580 [Chelatococcus sp.]|uniref:hypothetical protein n=1 Tax=Chelatococcus sp. TaxID=1953771 RepID=UPI0025C4FC72|nr:hypothetical protein [Chelatococcus sp.]MBX3537679.1 hypothetical protein [Chelatococcus sp.]
MSAVNIVVSSQRGWLLSDTSVYNASGTVLGFVPKVFPVARWKGVIAVRGNLWGLDAAHALAEQFSSVEEYLAESAPELKRQHEAADARGELIGQSTIEITVLAWSEAADRTAAYVLSSPSPLLDKPPYQWESVLDDDGEGFSLAPSLSIAQDWHLHRRGVEPGEDWSPERFDPVAHGIPLLEEQRRSLTDPRVFPKQFYVVGGHILVSEVTRAGVSQSVIHEWQEDRVGELIRPAAFEDEANLPLVPPSWLSAKDRPEWLSLYRQGRIGPDLMPIKPVEIPANMNRQQRRLLEKKQRKAAAA